MLRFAILRDIGEVEVPATDVVRGKANRYTVVLEYVEAQLLSRLQARVRENLIGHERWHTHTFSKDQVKEALDKAFNELVKEFKEKTITLP